MGEDDWAASTAPQTMLSFLRERDLLSERKARLLACAGVRRIWHLLADERSRAAVEVAERYADGWATEAERQAALDELDQARDEGVARLDFELCAYARH